MRLIDADALLKAHCCALDGEYKSCGECLEPPYGCCSLDVKGEDIFNAPTIDAIPVEWLRKWPKDLREGAYVRDILRDWQKEQEANQ